MKSFATLKPVGHRPLRLGYLVGKGTRCDSDNHQKSTHDIPLYTPVLGWLFLVATCILIGKYSWPIAASS